MRPLLPALPHLSGRVRSCAIMLDSYRRYFPRASSERPNRPGFHCAFSQAASGPDGTDRVRAVPGERRRREPGPKRVSDGVSFTRGACLYRLDSWSLQVTKRSSRAPLVRTHRPGKGKRRSMGERDFIALIDGVHQLLKAPIVLVWDRQNTHVSHAMRELVAEREWLTVFLLPTYSPDLNPVEWVWAHVKRSLANLAVVTLDRLESVVRKPPQTPSVSACNPRRLHSRHRPHPRRPSLTLTSRSQVPGRQPALGRPGRRRPHTGTRLSAGLPGVWAPLEGRHRVLSPGRPTRVRSASGAAVRRSGSVRMLPAGAPTWH